MLPVGKTLQKQVAVCDDVTLPFAKGHRSTFTGDSAQVSGEWMNDSLRRAYFLAAQG
jgi:hypothetical protein